MSEPTDEQVLRGDYDFDPEAEYEPDEVEWLGLPTDAAEGDS